MDDLISRQAAIDAFLTELTKRERKNLLHTWSTVEVKYFITKMLEQLPSAQPEIIRCKECKYSEYWYKDKRRCFLWHGAGIDVFEDGYCNYAERRLQ